MHALRRWPGSIIRSVDNIYSCYCLQVESSLSEIHALSQLLAFEVFTPLTPRARRLTTPACQELLRVCQYTVTTALAALHIEKVSVRACVRA